MDRAEGLKREGREQTLQRKFTAALSASIFLSAQLFHLHSDAAERVRCSGPGVERGEKRMGHHPINFETLPWRAALS
jgi:hypothetical protein